MNDSTKLVLRCGVANKMVFSIAFTSRITALMASTIRHHYADFEDPTSDEETLSFVIGGRFDSPRTLTETGGVFLTEESATEVNRKYKGARWNYSLSGLNDRTLRCSISGNLLGYRYLVGTVIDFCILLSSVDKHIPLIHASGIQLGKNGILLSGRGGAGKTTIATRLVADRGAEIVSDNYLFLENGVAHSYPAPLNLFSYNITPKVYESLSARMKMEFHLKRLLGILSLDRIKLFVTPTIREILGEGRRTSMKPTCLVLLTATNGRIETSRVDRDFAVRFLTSNQMMENTLYNHVVANHGHRYPSGRLSTFWERYQEQLWLATSGIKDFVKVGMPKGPIDELTLRSILEEVAR